MYRTTHTRPLLSITILSEAMDAENNTTWYMDHSVPTEDHTAMTGHSGISSLISTNTVVAKHTQKDNIASIFSETTSNTDPTSDDMQGSPLFLMNLSNTRKRIRETYIQYGAGDKSEHFRYEDNEPLQHVHHVKNIKNTCRDRDRTHGMDFTGQMCMFDYSSSISQYSKKQYAQEKKNTDRDVFTMQSVDIPCNIAVADIIPLDFTKSLPSLECPSNYSEAEMPGCSSIFVPVDLKSTNSMKLANSTIYSQERRGMIEIETTLSIGYDSQLSDVIVEQEDQIYHHHISSEVPIGCTKSISDGNFVEYTNKKKPTINVEFVEDKNKQLLKLHHIRFFCDKITQHVYELPHIEPTVKVIWELCCIFFECTGSRVITRNLLKGEKIQNILCCGAKKYLKPNNIRLSCMKESTISRGLSLLYNDGYLSKGLNGCKVITQIFRGVYRLEYTIKEFQGI